jgi:chaperonin GroEL (HSP60 family)
MRTQMGDGTNFVIVLAGELLVHAEALIQMGLSPSEIVEGYVTARKLAIEMLESAFLVRSSQRSHEAYSMFASR